MKKIVSVFIIVAMCVCSFSSTSEAKRRMPKATWNNIMWLASAMYAENGSGSDKAVLLTGIVIMKRVKSRHYPNTIKGVLSQRGQYATWRNGQIQRKRPDSRCLEIAEEILRYKLEKRYPNNLVFQAEFRQGKRIYRKIKNEYFCLA